MSTLTVDSPEFVIRSKIEPAGVALLDPSKQAELVGHFLEASKGMGFNVGQLRVESRSSLFVERCIEGFSPEFQVLARVNPLELVVSCGRATRKGRVTTAILFDQLVTRFASLLGTSNAAISTWSFHAPEALVLAAPAGPTGLGAPTRVGHVFSYGAASWDASVIGSQVVVEPSSLISGGTFVSFTNVWAKSEESLIKRLDHLWSRWADLVGISLEGPLA